MIHTMTLFYVVDSLGELLYRHFLVFWYYDIRFLFSLLELFEFNTVALLLWHTEKAVYTSLNSIP